MPLCQTYALSHTHMPSLSLSLRNVNPVLAEIVSMMSLICNNQIRLQKIRILHPPHTHMLFHAHMHMWQNQEADIFDIHPGLIACCWQRLLERLVVPSLFPAGPVVLIGWLLLSKGGCPGGGAKKGNWTLRKSLIAKITEIIKIRMVNHPLGVSSVSFQMQNFFFFLHTNNVSWLHLYTRL